MVALTADAQRDDGLTRDVEAQALGRTSSVGKCLCAAPSLYHCAINRERYAIDIKTKQSVRLSVERLENLDLADLARAFFFGQPVR